MDSDTFEVKVRDLGAVPLRAMRVGEIIDRAISILPRVLVVRPVLYVWLGTALSAALLSYCNSILQNNHNVVTGLFLIAVILITWTATIILNLIFSITTTIAGGEYWVQNEISPGAFAGRINSTRITKMFGLNAIIGIAFMLLIVCIPVPAFFILMFALDNMFIKLVCMPFLLLLLFPAILFGVNRVLAQTAFILESQGVFSAMERSKRLMTYHPTTAWYSANTPMMRVSGIVVVLWLISMLPSMLLGASSVGLYSLIESGETTQQMTKIDLALYFLSQAAVLAVTGLTILTNVGFYFDLRLRCEGLDLEQQLHRIRLTPHAVPTNI